MQTKGRTQFACEMEDEMRQRNTCKNRKESTVCTGEGRVKIEIEMKKEWDSSSGAALLFSLSIFHHPSLLSL